MCVFRRVKIVHKSWGLGEGCSTIIWYIVFHASPSCDFLECA